MGDKTRAERDKLLALLAVFLTFDFDTILAAAGGVPYSESYDWNEFMENVIAAVERR